MIGVRVVGNFYYLNFPFGRGTHAPGMAAGASRFLFYPDKDRFSFYFFDCPDVIYRLVHLCNLDIAIRGKSKYYLNKMLLKKSLFQCVRMFFLTICN